MCGIMGYTGRQDPVEAVLSGLSALEYRGYDSAGIGLFGEGELYWVKTAGKVSALREKLQRGVASASCAAIGHTRWATHGAPTDANSHPHGTRQVLLVHNGIIENHEALRKELLAEGAVFLSETDTEAAALLLDRQYGKTKDPKRAMLETVKQLEGAFAFCAVFADIPGRIYGIRRGSPLVLGVGEGETVAASDITAILPLTRRYIPLEEEVLAEISPEGVQLWKADGSPAPIEVREANWQPEQAQKGGFDHFMRKEIEEEPEAVTKTLSPRIRNGLPHFEEELPALRLSPEGEVRVIACGTALHAGMLGARAIRSLVKRKSSYEVASEFRYGEHLLTPKDHVILLSQSGETADTLAALRLAKESGAGTTALVNVVGSSIAQAADQVLYTHAGPEIAVASTKAYTVQAALFTLLSVYLGYKAGELSEEEAREYTKALEEDLPRGIRAILAREEEIVAMAKNLYQSERAFFIGRGPDYDAATEASLKMKEISYIHSEAYPAGEMKHGTISLMEEGIPVIVSATSQKHREKLCSNVKEVLARGARVFAVVSAEDEAVSAIAHHTFRLPSLPESVSTIVAQTVFQLLAYHVARLRECPIDQPRNLAKSVTVE